MKKSKEKSKYIETMEIEIQHIKAYRMQQKHKREGYSKKHLRKKKDNKYSNKSSNFIP